MSKHDNNKPTESETILMALDQISQTIDVMTSVVSRLRTYLQQKETTAVDSGKETGPGTHPNRVLH